MAILICGTRDGVPDYADRRIYLGKSFYACAHAAFVTGERRGVLTTVASLGYGDELVLAGDALDRLLADVGALSLPSAQLDDERAGLREVLSTATRRGEALFFAGDMHPVLPSGQEPRGS